MKQTQTLMLEESITNDDFPSTYTTKVLENIPLLMPDVFTVVFK